MNWNINAPKKTGIYIFKKDDEILYVGKSVNLFNRMKQYKNGAINSAKTHQLIKEATTVNFTITNNENDALLLERNLIDENNPPFNIKLKDNRRYPYLSVKKDNKKIEIKTIYKIRATKSKNEYIFGPWTLPFNPCTIHLYFASDGIISVIASGLSFLFGISGLKYNIKHGKYALRHECSIYDSIFGANKPSCFTKPWTRTFSVTFNHSCTLFVAWVSLN